MSLLKEWMTYTQTCFSKHLELVDLDMIELREQDGERIVELAHLWYREVFLPNLRNTVITNIIIAWGFRSNAITFIIFPEWLKLYPITLNKPNPTEKRMRTCSNQPTSSVNVLYLKNQENI